MPNTAMSMRPQACVKLLLISALTLGQLIACGDPTEVPERVDAAGKEVPVQEPIAFTSTNYNFTGPKSISELISIIPADQFVWHGFAPNSPYPVQGDCEPGRTGEQVVSVANELPMTIEGIVTLHPRYFQKRTICGEDERFYASYFLQDSTGGIVVLKDSRIEDFTYGARVRLRVRGVVHQAFGVGVPPFRAVIVHDQQEIISTNNDIYYETTDAAFVTADIGKVKRITGKIVSEATNNNFNEMLVQHPTDPSITWLVSLDRELGQRNPELCQGDSVTLTGPMLDNFGLRLIIASLGQIEFDPNACKNKP